MKGPSVTPLRGMECAKWAIVLAVIQVVTFCDFFFKNEILMPSDVLFELAPWRDYQPADYDGPENRLMFDPVMAFRPDFQRLQESLRDGRWPLWNETEMGGVPLLANCQSRVFFPPHLLLLFMDVDTAMSLFIVIKLWLAALVAYVCARLLGFSIWPSRWFSMVWGLGCFSRIWTYWPITDVLIWVPVVFVGTTWIAERQYRRGFFALLLGGTMLLFGGHPETAFAINAYLALYFVLCLAIRWIGGDQPWRPIVLYGSAWGLALAVYAVQLVPFLEYLMNSAPVEARIKMPLTASALTSFWVPRFFGTNAEGTFWDQNVHNSNLTIQQYAGIAVWFGIAFAIYYVIRKRPEVSAINRARSLALLIVTFLSLAMAMNVSFLKWAHDLPGFSHMRTIYHVYFALFAIPVIGLIGLDGWFTRPRRIRELSVAAITAVPAVIIVGVILTYNEDLIEMAGHSDYVLREVAVACAVAIIAVVALIVHCVSRRAAFAWAILVVATFFDVFWPIRGLNPSLPRTESFDETPVIAYMQDKPKPARFDLLGAAIAPGTIGNFGIEEWDGYDGLYPERPVRFREALSIKVWDRAVSMLGVDYYINDPRYDELAPIQRLAESGALEREITLDGLDVYRHVGMLPRARLVGNLETASSTDLLFERMLDDTFDPAVSAISDDPPPGPLPNSEERNVGTATITDHAPDRIVVNCEAESDAVLVLAENFYPGWRATIDGEAAGIFPVYYTFRGVQIPRGAHVVEFRYEPASVTIGLSISVAALILSAGLAIALKPRKRN